MGPNGSLLVRPRRASRTQFEHLLPDSDPYLRAIEIDRTDKRAARREKQQESADLLGQNDLIIDKIIVGSEQFEKGGGRRHPVVFKCEQHNAVRFRKDSKKPSMKDAIRNRQKAIALPRINRATSRPHHDESKSKLSSDFAADRASSSLKPTLLGGR